MTGIRDYGDAGVAEYVTANLIRRLGGDDGFPPLFGEISGNYRSQSGDPWYGSKRKNGGSRTCGLHADIRYYSRTRSRNWKKRKAIAIRSFLIFCGSGDVICSCLSKNVVLLGEEEFQIMGPGKVLFNTALSPCFEEEAIKKWLDQETPGISAIR